MSNPSDRNAAARSVVDVGEPIVREIHIRARRKPCSSSSPTLASSPVARHRGDARSEARRHLPPGPRREDGSGGSYHMRGEFLEVSQPERVVFTWGFTDPDVGAARIVRRGRDAHARRWRRCGSSTAICRWRRSRPRRRVDRDARAPRPAVMTTHGSSEPRAERAVDPRVMPPGVGGSGRMNVLGTRPSHWRGAATIRRSCWERCCRTWHRWCTCASIDHSSVGRSVTGCAATSMPTPSSTTTRTSEPVPRRCVETWPARASTGARRAIGHTGWSCCSTAPRRIPSRGGVLAGAGRGRAGVERHRRAGSRPLARLPELPASAPATALRRSPWVAERLHDLLARRPRLRFSS